MFGVASLSLPPALIGAAVVDQALVWLLPVGAWATLGGCLAGALRARRHGDRLSASGWLLVFASMAGGMLVGGFAFGGPLPAPAFLADYHGLGRTLVRGAHVISVTLGIAVIAAGASRTFAVAAR